MAFKSSPYALNFSSCCFLWISKKWVQKYPKTIVRKSWAGQLDEVAIFAFFQELRKIDGTFGITARSSRTIGYDSLYRTTSPSRVLVDLPSGHLSQVVTFLDHPRFDLRPRLSIDLQSNGYRFHLTY
mgnify:CR=1 FL=1